MLSLSTQLDREWQPDVTEPNHRRSCLLRADLLGELLFHKKRVWTGKGGIRRDYPTALRTERLRAAEPVAQNRRGA